MLDDLVFGDDVIFLVIGVFVGELLDGVKFFGGDLVEIYFIVMCYKIRIVWFIKIYYYLDYKLYLNLDI